MGHSFYFLTSGTSSKAVSSTHELYIAASFLVKLNSRGGQKVLQRVKALFTTMAICLSFQILTWTMQPR